MSEKRTDFSELPQELLACCRWLVWKQGDQPNSKGKLPKLPCDSKTGAPIDKLDAACLTFADAVKLSSKFSGIGLMPSGLLIALDFDDCFAEGAITEPWVKQIVSHLQTYTEVSPSGKGLRCWIKGEAPRAPQNDKTNPLGLYKKPVKKKFEIYPDSPLSNYVTVTGNRLTEFPATIAALNKEDLGRLYAEAEREGKTETKVADTRLTEFARLRLLEAGDWRTIYPQGSQSDADLEYCVFLAREHRGQKALVDAAFRRSKLMREKWDEQRGDRTYGERTLELALSKYKPQPDDVNPDSWPALFPTYQDWVDVPEPRWVIEKLMHEGEITMDGALPKHGKTWWELAKAKALLSGEPFLGHFKVREKATRVVYLVPEAGIAQMKRRLVLMRMMDFVREGRLFVMPRRLPLVTNLDDARIMKAAEGADVFLDTVVRFVKGDENKAVEVKQFSELCLNLATIARTVHAAHHAPKAFEEARKMTSENMLRGSGDLGAMISNAFGLRQIDKETNRIHVSCLVARDDDEYLADFQIEGRPHINNTGNFKLTLQPGDAGTLDDHLPTGGKPGPKVKCSEEQLREIRRMSRDGMSQAAIGEKFGIPGQTIGRWLKLPATDEQQEQRELPIHEMENTSF